ncbi:MAG TPA: hypothetical protein VFA10_12895 [Ktedonobacteraceae bacterium]|nr:hypothetical protein [Ktedonobacteraceae bacterium]
MNSTQITDLLLIIQATITLFISLRAFFLSARTGDNMLFSLGLSMGVIALGGMIGLVSDLFLDGAFNTFWFRYIGQTVGYLFIFLSTLRRSERYRRTLKRWHVLATGLLLGLLVLTPVIPAHPDPLVQTALSGSRGLICFIIFFHYVTIFFSKETRFGFLMCFAFFWIAWGIIIYTLQFTQPNPLLLNYVGDSTRIVGLAALLAAFFLG